MPEEAPPEDVFGAVIDGSDVERALLAHLQAWMPTTIVARRRQLDPEAERWKSGVAPIRSYTVTHAAAEKWPEDQLPMLLAYAPGLAEAPHRHGDGLVTARFAVTLTAIASGASMEDTKELARLYSSAAKLAILQEPSLSAGGETPFAEGCDLVAEENFPITRGVEAERSLMAVACGYLIEVDGILDTNGGIREPLKDPEEVPPPWPTVKTTDLVADLTDSGFFDDDV